MLKRVKKKFNAKNKTQQGISFDEVKLLGYVSKTIHKE